MPTTRRDALTALAIAALCCAAHARSVGCDFVDFDDPLYVTSNPHVLGGLSRENAAWALKTFHAANWHPLTWLSLQLDATAFGHQPRGFHLTNVLLHSANAGLVFCAFRGLTGAFWRSVVVALLFAVHPLRVESVAWVSERKDVLSAAFGFLALGAYAAYVKRPSVWRYLAVAACFTLSLMAKPMLVTLPFLLLALDWWPLGRLRAGKETDAADVRPSPLAPVHRGEGEKKGIPSPRSNGARGGTGAVHRHAAMGWAWLVAEKLPLFTLTLASCVITLAAQARGGAVAPLADYPAAVRWQNAAVAYATYLGLAAWPVGLSVYYRFPPGGWPPGRVAGAVAVVVALTALAVWQRRRRPYLLAGWLWYVGTLVPVAGLVQVGSQAYADRYTYFPLTGIFLAAVWAAGDAVGQARARVAPAAAAALVVCLAALTWFQIGSWRNGVALWEHNLDVCGPSEKGLNNLGEQLLREGQTAEAVGALSEAVNHFPNSAAAHCNLGGALTGAGKLSEARRQLDTALRLDPNLYMTHVNLGILLSEERKYDEAVECYRKALALQPENALVRAKLGSTLWLLDRDEEAMPQLNAAVRLGPNNATARYALGQALADQGRYAEAADQFAAAVRLRPRQVGYRLALAAAVDRAGGDAGPIVRQVAAENPGWAEGVTREARALAEHPGATPRDGRHAAELLRVASKFTGDSHPRLYDALAVAHARAGQLPEAVAAAERALAAAEAAGQPELARAIAGRLTQYRAGRTTADPPSRTDPGARP